MKARPWLAGAVVAASLGLAGWVPSGASAASQWQSFSPSAVVPDDTTLGSAQLDGAGRALVPTVDSTGFATMERTAGQTSVVRRQVTGAGSTSQAAVIDTAGLTVAAWVDGSGVHVRTRSGDAAFGTTANLGGVAGKPIDIAAVGDGGVVLAQAQTADTMRIWRRSASGTTFAQLPDVTATGLGAPEQIEGQPVVRGGQGSGAVVLFTTRMPLDQNSGNLFVRSISLIGNAMVPLEMASSAPYGPNSFNTFQVDDATILDDGTVVAAYSGTYNRTVSGVNYTFGALALGRRANDAWTSTQPMDTSYAPTGDPFSGPSAADVVAGGSQAYAVYGRRDEHVSSGTPSPLSARVARVTTAFEAPLTALTTLDAPYEGVVHGAAALAGGPIVLMTRGGTLTSQALTSEGAPDGEPQILPGSGTLRDDVAVAGDGASSAIAAALRGPAGDLHLVTSFLDGEAPALSVTVPATATVGQPVPLSATVTDREDPAVPVAWDSGGGGSPVGTAVQVTYPTAGTKTVKATATDAAGNSTVVTRTIEIVPPPSTTSPTTSTSTTTTPSSQAGPSPAPAGGSQNTADRTAPVLTGLVLTPSRLRQGKRGTLRWQSTEAATVVVNVDRQVRGYRTGGRCVARRPSGAKGRRARRCTLMVKVGTARGSTAAGTGHLTIGPKVGRRRLAPGTYRLTAVATDAAGNHSNGISIKFTVKRP